MEPRSTDRTARSQEVRIRGVGESRRVVPIVRLRSPQEGRRRRREEAEPEVEAPGLLLHTSNPVRFQVQGVEDPGHLAIVGDQKQGTAWGVNPNINIV